MINLRFYFMLCAIVVSMLIFDAFALGSGTWAWGNIAMTNGEKLDSVYFNMPMNYDSQITVKLNGSKVKVQSDSIDHIVLWHNRHPEEKVLIKYVAARHYVEKLDSIVDSTEKNGTREFKLWLCLDQVGPHCSHWWEIGRPSFKGGHFRMNYNKMYSHLSRGYVVRQGDVKATHTPDKNKHIPRWVELLFADDPVLIEKFRSGGYDCSDWGYKTKDIGQMVDDYAPRQTLTE